MKWNERAPDTYAQMDKESMDTAVAEAVNLFLKRHAKREWNLRRRVVRHLYRMTGIRLAPEDRRIQVDVTSLEQHWVWFVTGKARINLTDLEFEYTRRVTYSGDLGDELALLTGGYWSVTSRERFGRVVLEMAEIR